MPLLIGVWFVRDDLSIALILGASGVLGLFLGLTFSHLTVEDHGDRLGIRFGPLPLFRRTVRYSDIERIEVGRTLLLDSLGIHYSLRGGWVWSIWGRDCVVVHLKKSVLRIGTDDAEKLARFLELKSHPTKSMEN